jgi:hypothetical protein
MSSTTEAKRAPGEQPLANATGEPIVVVAQAFNSSGFNAEVASGAVEGAPNIVSEGEVWSVADGEVTTVLGGELPVPEPREGDASPLHLLRVLVGFVLLLLPGNLAFRFFLADHPVAESVGMVPALIILSLLLVGALVVAVTQSPLDTTVAWTTLVITTLLSAGLFGLGRRRPRAE